ncbi:MAG: T9SS type A sorting domain-containing protein [Bacteroidia bacterium]
MKKKLLIICAMAYAAMSVAQTPCSELFLSMYVCGSGDNKAVEIYNPTNAPITLNGKYRLALYYSTNTTTPDTLSLHGTIGSYSTFVVACGQTTTDSVLTATPHYATPPCDTTLQRIANQLDVPHYPGATYFSGSQSMTLQKNMGTPAAPAWVSVDIMGCPGEYPKCNTDTKHYGWWNVSPYNNACSGQAWTKYHTLIRKPSVQMGVMGPVNPGTFNPQTQWDSLPDSHTGGPQYYPAVNTNSTNPNTHFCTCNTSGIQEYASAVHVNVFPNPSSAGTMNIVAARPVEMIEIYNMAGELVHNEKIGDPAVWVSFNTSSLSKGTYMVKSYFGVNQFHVSKIEIQ